MVKFFVFFCILQSKFRVLFVFVGQVWSTWLTDNPGGLPLWTQVVASCLSSMLPPQPAGTPVTAQRQLVLSIATMVMY